MQVRPVPRLQGRRRPRAGRGRQRRRGARGRASIRRDRRSWPGRWRRAVSSQSEALLCPANQSEPSTRVRLLANKRFLFQLEKRRCGESERVLAQGWRRPLGWSRLSPPRVHTMTPMADIRLQVSLPSFLQTSHSTDYCQVTRLQDTQTLQATLLQASHPAVPRPSSLGPHPPGITLLITTQVSHSVIRHVE